MSVRVRALLIAAAIVPRVAAAQPADAPPPEAATPEAKPVDDSAAPIKPAVSVDVTPQFKLAPFGYLRMQYIAVQNDPNVASVGRDDGFELQNARFGVTGKLEDLAVFVLAIDGAVEERAQINTTQGKLRVGLRDAYADILAGFGLAVRGGFFHAWVDPESLEPDTSRQFVDHPIESRGMRATEGYETPGLTAGRSLGAALQLDPGPVGPGEIRPGFELAVQNGADEFSANNDNDKPAISVSGVVRLPRDSWVMAGVRYNPRTVGDLPALRNEDDYQAIAGLDLRLGVISLGGGIVYTYTTYPTTGGPSQTSYGGHAQALVTIPGAHPISLGYRFGILDPSSLITTDRVMEHTAGGEIDVPRYHMRVQLQLTHVVEQRSLENDRVQVAAEIAL